MRMWGRWIVAVLAGVSGVFLQSNAGEAITQEHFLGKAKTLKNVTVWPVYSKERAQAVKDYVTLPEAQKQKLAEVKETGAAAQPAQPTNDQQQAQTTAQVQQQEVSGQVNRLVITNKSDKPILVLAGSLVKGGKQDRLIAQDFIIPPKKTVPVDAFCVEQGRWTATREGKQTDGVFEAKAGLATFGARKGGQYKRNQGQVWEEVAASNKKAGKAPETGTLMATVEEKDENALARRAALRSEIEQALQAEVDGKKAVGIAYAVDGKVREIRVFNHPKIFDRYVTQIVATIAIEGDLAQRAATANKQKVYDQAVPAAQVVQVVKAVEQAKREEVETAADNVNYYRAGKGVAAAETRDKTVDASEAPVTRSWVQE